MKDKRKRMKSSTEKKRYKDKAQIVDQSSDKEEKLSRKKKQRKNWIAEHETVAANNVYKEDGSGEENQVANKALDNEKRHFGKKKKKNEKKSGVGRSDEEAVDNTEQQNAKSKEAHKKKKNQLILSSEDKNLSENGDSIEDDAYQISSGDEDHSKGMKKWIMEYQQRRPGLNVLQERIDDFMAKYEARVEQERKEREAQAVEDGWTVVVHHKGRKKTTDTESGVVVGSVAQATALDKMTKKKNKQVGLDFYRFQKREAQRSEIMMLRSKFEQDKKRIQQMRAARKFRPY